MSVGTSAIVKFSGVTKRFATRSGELHAVDDVTLDILEGEIFGVIGYSGAGKSTLVRLINALELASSGTIEVDGREITGLSEGSLRSVRAGIGMIFQQFNLLASRTVAGNVAYALEVAKWPKAERKARVAELLEFVGISEKARQYPGQLSGGQKQRVGIARALATNPRILLADEATSALDPETTQDVLALLKKVNQDLGITVVVITHEMDVVKSICDRVAVMERGKVVELGDVYSVFANPRHRATRRFVESSIKDRPTAAVLERLRHRHPGRLITVSVHEDGTSGGRITDVLAEHKVQGTIIFGGISEVTERPFGSLTWELTGAPVDVERAVARLQGYTRVADLGTAEQPLVDPDMDDASPPEDSGAPGDGEAEIARPTKDAENAAQVGGTPSFNPFAPFRRGNR